MQGPGCAGLIPDAALIVTLEMMLFIEKIHKIIWIIILVWQKLNWPA